MGKGRNKELIRLRNRELLRRYHRLTEIERLRFDDAIKKLSEEEFFISETTVVEIIQKYYNRKDYEAKDENREE